MTGFRIISIVPLLAMLAAGSTTVAQNNTNSPYTRYGYGQLADQGSGNSKGMGGVAYGLRDGYMINSVNPASYTAVDSLTFIFDGGISLQNTNFSNGTLKRNAHNSSFDYISMQFRACKWAAFSLGMLPYSNVGYSMSTTRDLDGVTYSGDGGVHQLYAGAGFKVWKDLSVGANFSYMWGSFTHTASQSFLSNADAFNQVNTEEVSISSYKLDFGVQYTRHIDEKNEVTLGIVFTPGHDLDNNATYQTSVGNDSYGYTTNQRDSAATCGIPNTWGVGLAYIYDNRLTVGADYTIQKWGNVTYMNNSDAFSNRARISVGAEYQPNPYSRGYLSVMKYRLGAYFSQPYYKIEGVRAAKEYGVTLGLGLPLPRARSMLNLSAQYVRVNGRKGNFLDENTIRICVGVTFNERWFFKSRVD